MNWLAYTEAAQRLSDVRQREAQRRAQVAERNTGLHGGYEQLKTHLAAQREHLSNTAERLRVPAPAVSTPQPAGVTDAGEALRLAWESVYRADAEAGQADQRARQAGLFPTLQQGQRNLAIYALAALVFAVLSVMLYVVGSVATHGNLLLTLPASLCAMPALAFAAGYVTIVTAGQPRVAARGRTTYSVKAGWLICFAIVWALWLMALVIGL